MRHLLRMALVGCLLGGPLSGLASAVSVEDLLHLKANGLSDEVLIALIESDGSVFHPSAADVVALYKRGLSEKVILAMIASGRSAISPTPPPRETNPPPIPDSVESSGRTTEREVPAAPVVHVTQTVVQQVRSFDADTGPVFIPVPFAVLPLPAVLVRPVEPVFWGFGGKLRPGSWQPAPEDLQASFPARPSSKTR